MITNIMRKKQIVSFIDKDRPVMMQFYELMEDDLTQTKLLNRMYQLVEKDRDFFDTYLVIAGILEKKRKKDEAHKVLKKAYEGALDLIVDAHGRWPKQMLWGHLENRHIMRALEAYGNLCWLMNQLDEALAVFKNLLSVNPNDNQGVRYSILAIRLGLSINEFEEPFYVIENNTLVGLDAHKISTWFEKNARHFPDDFQAFFDYNEDNPSI